VFSNGLSRKDKERTRKGQGKDKERTERTRKDEKRAIQDEKRTIKDEKRTSVRNILVFLTFPDPNPKKHLF
jgi:hypothetical protein